MSSKIVETVRTKKMESFAKEEEKQKKVNKIKIFTVPFALREVEKNINIITDATSKEEIINQAFKYHKAGNILKAAKYYQYFIEKGFTNTRVFCYYGVILEQLGKVKEAFDCYIKVIELDPNFPNIYPAITTFLRNSDPSKLNKSKLKDLLNLLFEKNNIQHKELFNAFIFLYRNEIKNIIERDSFDSFIKDKLIINALKKTNFQDIRFEKILTCIRKYFCDRIDKHKEEINCSELQFIIALGAQCFLNEYIYAITEKEKISIKKIINRCVDGEINETNISILSCYFPLYRLLKEIPSLKSFNSSNQNFTELIILQISEPMQEIELSKSIRKLGVIENIISQKVKSQYEANPYPRWRYGNELRKKIPILEVINKEINPNLINQYIDNKKLNVLIAGSGTGNQILEAQKYKNTNIIAIDLSLSSLSYSQRKVNELGIDNVEIIQMDILEVSLLEEQFDVIECSGVLHHMEDSIKGLKALLNVLKPNGFLKLGLYSELARKDIVETREYIITNNLQPTDQDIKDLRENVFSGKVPQISNLRNWGDFYTMSECRDLCFHSQEHRFTINKLQKMIKSNELVFLGFSLPQSIKSLYSKYFPEDKKQTKLDNWERFEKQFPTTFVAMYQFWVCKSQV